MRTTRCSIVTVATAVVWLVAPGAARAQFGMLGRGAGSVGATVALPIGTFDESVHAGFGVALRSGGSRSPGWAPRSAFEFTQFRGKDSLATAQFLSTGGEIVHTSDAGWYQFGGLGMHFSRFYDRSSSGSATSLQGGRRLSSAGFDFGLTGGVGVHFGRAGRTNGFIEFAAVTVFTGATTTSWFPIRVGIRY